MFLHKHCRWRLDKDTRSRRSRLLDDLKIVYKAPQPTAPPYSVTHTACRRLLHVLGPAGQQKKGSARHSNTHFSKCTNYDGYGASTMWERGGSRMWEEGEKGSFIGGEVAAPRGAPAPRRYSPPLHGGNPPHQHEVTPILILHDIHAN
jgi:hypothetical protein